MPFEILLNSWREGLKFYILTFSTSFSAIEYWSSEGRRPWLLLIFSTQIICDPAVGSCAAGPCSDRSGRGPFRNPRTSHRVPPLKSICEKRQTFSLRVQRSGSWYAISNLIKPVERRNEVLYSKVFKNLPPYRILAKERSAPIDTAVISNSDHIFNITVGSCAAGPCSHESERWP